MVDMEVAIMVAGNWLSRREGTSYSARCFLVPHRVCLKWFKQPIELEIICIFRARN